ncbi:MAG: ATP-binding protein [Firmicutes bacterium]|nr:ATP-binding protein [Bacillota bacterium]
MINSAELKIKIDALTVFSDLKEDPVLQTFRALLDSFSVPDYSRFVASLYQSTDNLSEYIREIVLRNDNFYVKDVASGKVQSPPITEAVKYELMVLEEIAAVTAEDIQGKVRDRCPIDTSEIYLPGWKNNPIHLAMEFTRKLGNIHQTGYGIFARYTFFRVVDGKIVPVAHPDYQTLDELFGYERERGLIIRNTEALIEGKGCNNMLLYGDMGTGKSSTIKAVAAAYSDKGLRIVEIKKNQLFQIPDIMEELASNPLKFILFIDDLSFAGNDDNFSALKATLQGSISGCAGNTVIYATSNRRHLVKENASDRVAASGFDEDLHLNDTMQETMSLAARFGLTITFQKPNKEEYLAIVRALADEYGIPVISDDTIALVPGALTEAELFRRAEAHAIRRNGRSPRTARQFIELLKTGL